MDATGLEIARTAGIVGAALLALGLERWRPWAGRRGSVRVNVGLWVADLAATSLACGTCLWMAAAWAERADTGLFRLLALPGWAAIAGTILGLDLVSYWWHRANHRVRWLWRLHRVHHSDPTLTVTTALRFHPGEILLSLPLRMAAVAALGAPVVGIVAFEVVFALANLIEHGDVALPPRLERRLAGAVVTPAIHRRHHDERVANRERNFATVFTWWDRCFGTFGASDARDRWAIGTPELAVPTTLGAALALPFVRR